jgi:hypothetical protein
MSDTLVSTRRKESAENSEKLLLLSLSPPSFLRGEIHSHAL